MIFIKITPVKFLFVIYLFVFYYKIKYEPRFVDFYMFIIFKRGLSCILRIGVYVSFSMFLSRNVAFWLRATPGVIL